MLTPEQADSLNLPSLLNFLNLLKSLKHPPVIIQAMIIDKTESDTKDQPVAT